MRPLSFGIHVLTPLQSNNKEICKNFRVGKECPFGKNCHFLHKIGKKLTRAELVETLFCMKDSMSLDEETLNVLLYCILNSTTVPEELLEIENLSSYKKIARLKEFASKFFGNFFPFIRSSNFAFIFKFSDFGFQLEISISIFQLEICITFLLEIFFLEFY
jgi:hypothetical protein